MTHFNALFPIYCLCSYEIERFCKETLHFFVLERRVAEMK